MADTISIEKAPKLEKSQDYAFLRQAGLEHIKALGSRIWTDYNIHDPGITILESLCYAITDLGYRTSFDTQDLLGLKEGDGYFHTARNILTVNPTTINDFRKLLMDVEGVRMAWLIPSDKNEVPIYLDRKKGELTYIPQAISSKNQDRLILNGLYNILLDFEEDDEFGDLNDPVIERKARVNDKDETFEFTFPFWNELLDKPKEEKDLIRKFLDRGKITNVEILTITFDEEEKGYRYKIEVTFDYLKANAMPDPGFACGIDLPLDQFGDSEEALALLPNIPPFSEDFETDQVITFEILVRYPGRADKFEPTGKDLVEDISVSRLIDFYRQKIGLTLDIVDRAWCKLLSHRDLCEDFLNIQTLKTEEIAVCAEIEVKPDADVSLILAEIIHQIDTFISPPVNFYTIQQLFEKGYTSDQIFNGPALEHGFVIDEELDKAILKKVIHTSDLINIIMDIDGVMAVQSLQVANYLEGIAQTKGTEWTLCLQGDGLHVPKLSADKSKILFFKDVLPYRANEEEVAQHLAEMRVRDRRGRLKETPLDIEVPEGTDWDAGHYSTIQDHFPIAYGTTQYGIPGAPDALRKAQAKQLKAFLLFFEQILANYLAQLGHVKELFSMAPNAEDHTYYTQAITDPNDIEALLSKYDNLNGFDDVKSWLTDIAEDKELYEERKNRLLNHLMSRFAESFSEYSLLMYALRKDKAGAELIEDKQLFLADYPAISAERGKAYNYRPTLDCERCFPNALWNTRNVSGFKKRVARLLGMEDYHRRNLTCHMFEVVEIPYVTRDNVWVWKLFDLENPANVLLTSLEYPSEAEANYMITYAIAMIEEGKLFQDKDLTVGRICCNRVGQDDLSVLPPNDPVKGNVLFNSCNEVIACSPSYASDEAMQIDFDKIEAYIHDFASIENFHLIEHILLRPKFEGKPLVPSDKLLPICVDTEVKNSSEDIDAEFYLDVRGKWRFRVRTITGKVLLRSDSAFDSYESIKLQAESVNLNRRVARNVNRKLSSNGKFYFNISDNTGELIATSQFFDTETERERVIGQLSGNTLGIAPITEPEGSICLENVDPYSFRMSIILPSWAGRFRDVNFRRLVERTLRMEAPAHIALRICWIDREQMAEFECLYMKWILEFGRCDGSPEDVSPHLNALIDKMFALQNIYPVATLHDCDDDSGSDAQVVLNYTSLGTL